MKRLMLALAAVLLLTGCAAEQPQVVTEPTETTEPAGLYAPGSEVEQQSRGAVRMYPLAANTYFDLRSIGNHLLVAGEDVMLVLSGDRGEPGASMAVGKMQIAALNTAVTGMGYYLTDTREVVIRNPQLRETVRYRMPENINGTPVICLQCNEVYYSAGNEIRALHIETGISRLIRQQSTHLQTVTNAFFDGTVLECKVSDETGLEHTEYISAETGQTLADSVVAAGFQTVGETYFTQWFDGAVWQSVFGTRTGQTQRVQLREDFPHPPGYVAVLERNGVVQYIETEAGLELSYYDLESGKRTAQVTLANVQMPAKIHSDGTYVWLLAAGKEDNRQALYRWEVEKSPIKDDADYATPLYTAEYPDTKGLKQCRALADSIEAEFGVKVAIWKDATVNSGEDAVTAEYQPEVTQRMLQEIQTVLASFPEEFLAKTSKTGEIRISLVREIGDGEIWAQFWNEGNCCILIASGTQADQAFLQGIAYAIDSHVLGNSRDFDTWSKLNPSDFSYTNSYETEAYGVYLEGDTRAFADQRAMSYPHEDRCRIFYHAMLPDNEEVFASDTMQKKLLRLCMGIREAYELEESPDTYLWEQYLTESIAYTSE